MKAINRVTGRLYKQWYLGGMEGRGVIIKKVNLFSRFFYYLKYWYLSIRGEQFNNRELADQIFKTKQHQIKIIKNTLFFCLFKKKFYQGGRGAIYFIDIIY